MTSGRGNLSAKASDELIMLLAELAVQAVLKSLAGGIIKPVSKTVEGSKNE